jgi:hypothetical protein
VLTRLEPQVWQVLALVLLLLAWSPDAGTPPLSPSLRAAVLLAAVLPLLLLAPASCARCHEC